MKDGEFVFFHIQFRRTHESEWGQPTGPLKPVKENEWSDVGRDGWGHSLNPHIGQGNNWRPQNKEASEEMREIERATSYSGWYTLKYALAALSRLYKNDAEGRYDSTDNYKLKMAAVRHQFRLCKTTISKATEVLADQSNLLLKELL